MTMVALGLLLGLAGLLWLLVIDIMQEDHKTKKQSPRAQGNALAETVQGESKAA